MTMESIREPDLSTVEEKMRELDKIVLWILRTRGPLSEFQIVQEIFHVHGFSPPSEKVRKALNEFLDSGTVEKRSEGLVSVYRITERGEFLLNSKKSDNVVQ
ncbi:MAG: hypothetical protein QXG38_01965 [Candidatus Hadarchaeales archaeon]